MFIEINNKTVLRYWRPHKTLTQLLYGSGTQGIGDVFVTCNGKLVDKDQELPRRGVKAYDTLQVRWRLRGGMKQQKHLLDIRNKPARRFWTCG